MKRLFPKENINLPSSRFDQIKERFSNVLAWLGLPNYVVIVIIVLMLLALYDGLPRATDCKDVANAAANNRSGYSRLTAHEKELVKYITLEPPAATYLEAYEVCQAWLEVEQPN